VCSRLFLTGEREVESLTARQVRRLREDGFVIVDGFLDATSAGALRREALRLHSAGIKHPRIAARSLVDSSPTIESDHLPSMPPCQLQQSVA